VSNIFATKGRGIVTNYYKGRIDFHPIVEHEYVIESQEEIGRFVDVEAPVPLYWSNKNGWAPFFDSDKFSYQEAKSVNLPMGGAWVSCMTTVQCTMEDGSYITTEVSNLMPDPDLLVGQMTGEYP